MSSASTGLTFVLAGFIFLTVHYFVLGSNIYEPGVNVKKTMIQHVEKGLPAVKMAKTPL
ncbi:MAG: hypothetical protein ACKE5Q_07340 [Methylophilaceae bacterium]